MSLADIQSKVDDLVRDRDSVISPASRDQAIQDALARYSADVPRQVVVDVLSAGGWQLGLPAGWVEDASTLVAIEYPIGQMPVSQLAMDQVSIYASPTARYLVLPDDVVAAAGDALRVTYTAPHTLDDSTDTIRPAHRFAVASLGAAILCGQLASYYANESEPTISADTVDRRGKSDLYRSRQRDLAATYDNVIGKPVSDRQRGASVTVEVQRRDSLGLRRLFHPARNWPR